MMFMTSTDGETGRQEKMTWNERKINQEEVTVVTKEMRRVKEKKMINWTHLWNNKSPED